MTTLALQPANTADGYILNSGTVWATVRGAASGTSADSTNANLYESATARKFGSTYYITRSFFLFDTSSIPAGSTITSAVLSLWFSYASASAKTICVVQGTQGDTLTTADFSAVGSTDWSNRVALSSISTSAENQWTLNASGLAGITAAGTTYLAIRQGNDIDDSAPADNYYADAYSSNYSTASKRPKLTVEYTAGGSTYPTFLFRQHSNLDALGGY